MRFRWLAVVVLLGSVAMYAPIQAESGKRTATMSVRVLVVRPCLVSTAPGVNDVNCQAPGAPAPRMTTTPFQGPLPAAAVQPSAAVPDAAVTPSAVTAARSTIARPVITAPAAVTTLSADTTASEPAATTESASTAAAAGGSAASPVPAISSRRPARQLERLRVLTVNF